MVKKTLGAVELERCRLHRLAAYEPELRLSKAILSCAHEVLFHDAYLPDRDELIWCTRCLAEAGVESVRVRDVQISGRRR
jgi:hypothetical protein